MSSLTQLGQELENIQTIPELWAETLAALAKHSVEFVNYITVARDFTDPFVLTNVPQIYEGSTPEKDPFLSHCCTSYQVTPTGPAYLPKYDYLPDEAKAFIRAASETGFSTGLGIPMRLEGSNRFGGFNLGTRFDIDGFEQNVLPKTEDFRFFCLLIHRRIEELSQDGPPAAVDAFRDLLLAPPNKALDLLSRREREVIYLVGRGLSRKECARLCGISPHTVSEYTKNAYRKLGISNRVEAARLILDN